ncbi:MAG TPA: CotH kinase family protein [Chitinophagales bacterium]|nr:CotH kinase family protein [Chitinophagales bacterium]HRK27134.1 CotH kinase family protein [Chitinophagales bacterium]
MKKVYALLVALAWFSIAEAQVYINEFSAANLNSYTDNFGEYEDWIELYNAGPTAVNLAGYYLSDKIDNPTKWQFPAVDINAGGYLRVFASTRNITTGATLHTNFRITQTAANEAVVLADPSGTIIDSYPITTPNKEGHSTGRVTNGAPEWGVFTTPSPNAANANAKKGYTATPDIEPSSGHYPGPVTVTITCADPTATIYYTTNGNQPTTGSTVYAAPFTVSNTTVIRAIAMSADTDMLSSFNETNTYLINENHTIPVLSISGAEVAELLDGDWGAEPIGAFELFDTNGQLLDEAEGHFNKHGNDSWAYDQRGFDYITRDQLGYDNEISAQIFANSTRNQFQRLILKPAANDNYPAEDGAHIRDAYVHELSQRANLDLDERTYEPCIVYLNGQYWGVYEIREKVDDNDFTSYYYDQGEEWIDFIKTWGATWEEYGSWDDWYTLHDYIMTNDMAVPANYTYVTDRLNALSLIDYMIINSHVVCADWLIWNTAWWRGRKDDGVKWRYTLWDMDASFGHYINYTGMPNTGPNAQPCDYEQPQVDDPEGHTDIVMRLMQNPDFHALYVNRYADLLNSYFSCDYMLNLLDELIARIEPEMPRQIARWGGTMTGWQNNVQELRNFILTRCAVIEQGVADCYDVDGPYDLTVDVQPPNSGNVTLNMINLTSYPWTGSYFGGVQIDLSATPNTGYEFDYWTINNNVIQPGTLSPDIWLNLTANDTLTAHFKLPIPTYQITLQVEPPTSGSISAGGFAFPAYPVNLFLLEGTVLDLEALAAAGFEFVNWTSNGSVLLPDANTPVISFTVTGNDTITAFFTPIIPNYNLTVDATPPNGGTLTLNGNALAPLPYSATYEQGTQITLTATPQTGYTFSYWETSAGITLPNPQQTAITLNLTADGSIIAHFEPITFELTITNPNPNAGSITLNGQTLTNFPYTVTLAYGETLDLNALAAQGFNFANWTINGTPTATAELLLTALENLTISVSFTPIVIPPPPPLNCEPAVPNAFSPNQDGVNDVFAMRLNPNCIISNYLLIVYDRWGNSVFETTDIQQGWDGFNKGSSLPLGVYVWYIQFDLSQTPDTTPETKIYKGNITLIR